MDGQVKIALYIEVFTQCHIAAIAGAQLDEALAAWPDHADTFRLWAGIQTILVVGANLSKLLWGSSAANAVDRAELRRELGVADDSPLRNRAMRNHFEHMDERIVASKKDEGADLMYSFRTISDDDPRHSSHKVFQWFSPATGNLAFGTDTLHLPALVREMDRLLGALNALFTTKWNWEFIPGEFSPADLAELEQARRRSEPSGQSDP